MRRLIFALPLLVLVRCAETRPVSTVTDAGTMDSPTSDEDSPASLPPPHAPAVLTQHYDNARTGANLDETVLSPTTVSKSTFGLLFARKVQGQIYTQPLFVPKLDIPNKGMRDVVFVATEHNDVYAFDADDPMATEPLWHVNLGPSVPSDDLTLDDTTIYRNIYPELGISSTPAIDRTRGTIYLCGMAKENGERINRVHALNIADGSERPGSPVTLTITAKGTGAGSVNGTITISQHHILQRPGLAIANDILWIAGGGHGDFTTPFHGWVNAYDATTLQLRGSYITTPDGQWGGIWMGSNGIAIDEDGYGYFETGDGSFDDTKDPPTIGDSFGKVGLDSKGVHLVDWFTPFDQAALSVSDADLGSTGPMLLPNTKLVVGGGKAGKLYLLNRDGMGHIHAGDDSQIVQSFAATDGCELYASPVYWESATDKRVYILPAEGVIHGYRFLGDRFETSAFTKSTWTAPEGTPGGAIALSADGNKAGTAILWALVQTEGNNGGYYTVPGALIALDADDLTHQLWWSGADPADAIGLSTKFTIPTVTGGKVFVPSADDRLLVYGLKH
jgi:hypothetical protein